MRTIQFEQETGLIVSNGSLVVLTEINAVLNKVQQRLRFFLGEWLLNTTVGIAYFQQIFEKPVDPGLVVSLISSDINLETDVISVENISFDFDRIKRNFEYSANIVTIYGSSILSTNISI